jgi:hypothetical protein
MRGAPQSGSTGFRWEFLSEQVAELRPLDYPIRRPGLWDFDVTLVFLLITSSVHSRITIDGDGTSAPMPSVTRDDPFNKQALRERAPTINGSRPTALP